MQANARGIIRLHGWVLVGRIIGNRPGESCDVAVMEMRAK